MPLDMTKVVMAFNCSQIGHWLKYIHDHRQLHIISPVRLFLSFQYHMEDDVKKANVINSTKEIVASMIVDGVIRNSQQILEIGVEKKLGPTTEVNIFLQRE